MKTVNEVKEAVEKTIEAGTYKESPQEIVVPLNVDDKVWSEEEIQEIEDYCLERSGEDKSVAFLFYGSETEFNIALVNADRIRHNPVEEGRRILEEEFGLKIVEPEEETFYVAPNPKRFDN